jgi:hypothetical protein
MNTSAFGEHPQPMRYMCERKGCARPADFNCEPIPGTTEPGWEKEPTARCEEHARGLIVLHDLRR